jgi:hypothetical protein
MTQLGPLMITAHNADQAEYLVRSRAEQRGVEISRVDVTGGDGGMWLVFVTVSDVAKSDEVTRLGDDTRALHIDHPVPPGAR